MWEDFYFDLEPIKLKDNSFSEPLQNNEKADIEDSFMTNFWLESPDKVPRPLCGDTSWLKSQFGDNPNKDVPDRILAGMTRPFDE